MIGWPRRAAPLPAAQAVVGAAADPNAYTVSPSVPTLVDPSSRAAEAFRRIAGEVVSRHLSRGRRGLVVCGASAGTGITVTAANLAVALSQMGTSTLLIEADLRSPSLDTLFKPPGRRPGLQQALRADGRRQERVEEGLLPNLSLMFAGGPAPDADQLLAGRRFHELVGACMRDHECTILDTPPANRFADARTVAAAVGYAIIVGRRRFTYLDDTSLLSQQLAKDGVSVVGSIFNETA